MADPAKDELVELGREISRFILDAVQADPGGAVGARLREALQEAVAPKINELAEVARRGGDDARLEIEALRAEVQAMGQTHAAWAQHVAEANRRVTELRGETRALSDALRRQGVAAHAPVGPDGLQDALDAQVGATIGQAGPALRDGALRAWLSDLRGQVAIGAVVVALALGGWTLWGLRGHADTPAVTSVAPPEDTAATSSVDKGWTRIIDDQRAAATDGQSGARERLVRLCGDGAETVCPTFSERFADNAADPKWREDVAALAGLEVGDRVACSEPETGVAGGRTEESRLRCLLIEAGRD